MSYVSKRKVLPKPPPVIDPDAARFLTQAAFAPTDALVSEVRSKGLRKWMDDQFSLPVPDTHWAYTQRRGPLGATTFDAPTDVTGAWEALWTLINKYPDKLRRRVALALSEVFIIGNLGDRQAMASYADVLTNNAFSNFRQLLEAVVRSPAMGAYHNYLTMGKETGSQQTSYQPDGSMARALMEQFTVGPYQLNLDGTPVLSSNAPVPTFTIAHVNALAKVLTGLSWGGTGSTWGVGYLDSKNTSLGLHYDVPMVMYGANHSTGAKTIIGDVVLPAASGNATAYAEADLGRALDALFNHANVGPFIGKKLIQLLVTSNPTPSYVARVASVFNNNGAGVRGDMKAVIKTIFTDQEAVTKNALTATTSGKLREPMLRWYSVVEAFGGSSTRGVITPPTWMIQQDGYGQAPFQSPNNTGFFQPDYAPTGSVAVAKLLAPELQLVTEVTAVAAANRAWWYDSTTARKAELGSTDPRAVWIPFTQELTLVDATAVLIDRLSLLVTGGELSSQTKTMIFNAVNGMSTTTSKQKVEKICAALKLVLNSPEYLLPK